jgi:ssDNA-binding Zn-finger/Zn-ribbon topoisomerase 1
MGNFEDAVKAGRPSYDDNQISCVLKTCPDCQKSLYMRPQRTKCMDCDPKPAVQ